MLSRETLEEMLDVADELGLWILLEAFDDADIAVMNDLVARRRVREGLLLGVNSRDLQTLQVVPERLLTLAGQLPAHLPRVAESGVGSATDAAAMAAVHVASWESTYAGVLPAAYIAERTVAVRYAFWRDRSCVRIEGDQHETHDEWTLRTGAVHHWRQQCSPGPLGRRDGRSHGQPSPGQCRTS